MGRLTRLVRNDATVKIDSVFYEVPPEFIGARVDIRFPIANPDRLILYRDDQPVRPIQPVDAVDNARFHAHKIETAYASLAQPTNEEPRPKQPSQGGEPGGLRSSDTDTTNREVAS